MQQSLNTMVADVRAALGSVTSGNEAGVGESPRYELFHAANSICSQKVRTVLEHHGIPYTSDMVNLFKGQTYLPNYVRLRLIGCGRLGVPLVAAHSGSTSVSAGGCDAAVVPTLIDWDTSEVILDSKRICLYLDEKCDDDTKLRPAALAAAVDEELEIVDNLPNYQMLMGKRPDTTEPGAERKGHSGSSFSLQKVERCDQLMQEHADDPNLVKAYAAKRAKELDAATVLFSEDAMRTAYATAEAACKTFDDKLRERGTPWLFGTDVTMADLFWGIELLRMKNMGAGFFWENGRLPHVARFLAAVEELPSIKAAIVDFPGALF